MPKYLFFSIQWTCGNPRNIWQYFYFFNKEKLLYVQHFLYIYCYHPKITYRDIRLVLKFQINQSLYGMFLKDFPKNGVCLFPRKNYLANMFLLCICFSKSSQDFGQLHAVFRPSQTFRVLDGYHCIKKSEKITYLAARLCHINQTKFTKNMC